MASPRHFIAPLLFGLIGAAMLVGLGVWQLQRLEWKRAVLAEIEAKVHGDPVSLPAAPDPNSDKYLPVSLTGMLTGAEAHVLTSDRETGPGFRILAAVQTDGGRQVLVDLGFIAEADLATARPTGRLTISGNLHWPNEVDSYTPPYDATRDIWFARDVATIAEALQVEPVLVIARSIDPPVPATLLLPVDSAGITNDHLQYAITWFCLALVWLGMTGLWLSRIRHHTD